MQKPIKITIEVNPKYEKFITFVICSLATNQYLDTTFDLHQGTDKEIPQRFKKLRVIRCQKYLDLLKEIEYLFKLERTFIYERNKQQQTRKFVKRS